MAPTVSSIGTFGIHAVLIVEVDRVDAEPLEARLAGASGRRRRSRPRGSRRRPGSAPGRTWWRRRRRARRPARARPRSSSLCPHPYMSEESRKVTPEIEGAVDHRDGPGVVALPVGAGHRHAAEPDRRHLQPARARAAGAPSHRLPCSIVRHAVSQPTRIARAGSRRAGNRACDRCGSERAGSEAWAGIRRRRAGARRDPSTPVRCTGARPASAWATACGCRRCGTAWPPRRPRPSRGRGPDRAGAPSRSRGPPASPGCRARA